MAPDERALVILQSYERKVAEISNELGIPECQIYEIISQEYKKDGWQRIARVELGAQMCKQECLCKTCAHGLYHYGGCGCTDNIDFTTCNSGGFKTCSKYLIFIPAETAI